MHDKESITKKIEQLEARMNVLMEKYKEIKNRLRQLGDEESEEAYNLGLAEFNLFNSIDMLDDTIQELKAKDSDL
jgi:formiminotetrahydrofolate cyclodeaminase